jgi:hypothetical protein
VSYPQNRPADELCIDAQLTDLSTSSTVYAVCPVRGPVTRAYATIANAITGANANLTLNLRGSAIGTAVVTQSGSAAGDVATFTMSYGTPSENLMGNEGDALSVHSDGGSSTTCVTNISIMQRKG